MKTKDVVDLQTDRQPSPSQEKNIDLLLTPDGAVWGSRLYPDKVIEDAARGKYQARVLPQHMNAHHLKFELKGILDIFDIHHG